jgi:hypothetical protein
MKYLPELVVCGRSVFGLLLCGWFSLAWLGGQNKLSEMNTARERTRFGKECRLRLRYLTALSVVFFFFEEDNTSSTSKRHFLYPVEYDSS